MLSREISRAWSIQVYLRAGLRYFGHIVLVAKPHKSIATYRIPLSTVLSADDNTEIARSVTSSTKLITVYQQLINLQTTCSNTYDIRVTS